MGLFKKNKIYYFAIMRDGRRIQRSTGSKNKKLAQEIYDKVYHEIVGGKWFKKEKARNKTFHQVWDRYEAKGYVKQRDKYTIKQLLPFFGYKTLAEIETIDVEDYITERLNSPKKPADSTIDKEYSLGRRMFYVAKKTWGWTTENPFADFDQNELLDTDNPRERVISIAEEIQLLNCAFNQDIRDFIIAQIHTACRRGETLTWDWNKSVNGNKSVDLFNRILIVKKNKRRKKKPVYKTIPMSDTLYKILVRRYKTPHISGKVFPMTLSEVRYAFDMTLKKSGMEDIQLRDCRRTFSTRLDAHGVPLHIIKALMGHSTNDVTEVHYIQRVADSLRKYVLLLDKYYEENDVDIDEVMVG
jgi:integrase